MSESLNAPSAEVRRIDFTGTIWFAAAIAAVGVPLAGLLSQGWRPSDLPTGATVVWWAGAFLILAGVGAFAWAGCPVLGTTVDNADKQKSLCIRVGVAVFIIGAVASGIAVLVVPA